jgi:hypothetical protein
MSVPEWAKGLPAELQEVESVRNTPDLATAVKRMIDLDRYKGSSIALPRDGDEASAKAFAEAVAKRGFIPGEIPADPTGYDVADVDLSTVGLDDAWKAGRLKDYHAMGLTKTQAKAALKREVSTMETALKAITEKSGPGGLEAIRRASAKYNLNGDPGGILNVLMEIGMSMTEDGTKPPAGAGSGGGMSLQEVDAKLAELDDKILKVPEYDARSKPLLDERYDLLRRRAALVSGDNSVLNVPFETFAKNVGRR